MVGDPEESRSPVGNGGRMRRWKAAVLLLAMPAACVIAQKLQRPFGSIEGRLTDLYSNSLDGAAVVLRNVSTGVEFTTVTGKNGAYRLTGLYPGAYVLEARTTKLGGGHVSGIVVTAGRAMRLQTAIALDGQTVAAWQAARTTWIGEPSIAPDALERAPGTVAIARPPVLALAGGTGRILAAAASASLRTALTSPSDVPHPIEEALLRSEPDEATVALNVDSEGLQALPLPARGPEPSVEATPKADTKDDEQVAARGHASERAGQLIDRSDTRMTFEGRAAGRRAAVSLLEPAASETVVRSIGTGETSMDTGGAAGTETRSGADFGPGRLHGQAFVFDRSSLLAAQNPFTEWTKEISPSTPTTVPVFGSSAWSPEDLRMRWGLAGGGPLARTRMFWYAGFENQRRNDPAVASLKHADNFFAQPTDDEMQVLSARLSMSNVDPVTEGLAAYSKMLETLAGLLGPARRTSEENTAFARVDWRAAEQHRFTVEAATAEWNDPGGGLSHASENYGTHSFGASRGSEDWVLGRWTAFMGSNLLAVTQGAIGTHTLTHPAQTPSPFEQALNVNPWGQLPQMVVDSRYGFTIGNPARFGAGSYPDEKSFEASENLEWLRGSLAVRSGFSLRYDRDRTSFVRNHTGTFHYARLENFASDALGFGLFGLSDALDPADPHGCDERGKAWRDTDGVLHGLGNLPCYSYYTQTVGPTEWHLETTDFAGFSTAQWRAGKLLTVNAGLRWERQMMPPPIALVANPDLPLAGQMPTLGNEWAPHVGLAWGTHESHWPVLRLGYGMVYARTPNSVVETALTQTGSAKGDLNLFLRPTDNLPGKTGGAPAFPSLPAGEAATALLPGAVEVSPTFRNGEVQQGVAAVEEELPGRVLVSANALASLGRRLPVTMDTNFDPALNPGTITYEVVDATGRGPIRGPQITVPLFASWPGSVATSGRVNAGYQQITEMMSRANSTYEAASLNVSRAGRRGLSFNARYTYAHAMDWNPDEGALRERPSVFDPLDFRQEYGASDLDLRHSVTAYAIWRSPWKLRGAGGGIANGWMLSGMGRYHSGLPYTMRTEGSLAEELTGNGLVVALGPGMNGYGGPSRVYGVGRNTYRYPATWKADVRLGKRFTLGRERELELMAQTFNLFNHQNVTELETVGYYVDSGSTSGSLPRLTFLTGLKDGQTEFGQPLNVNATDDYREREFEFGFRIRFKRGLED
ncbi:MAG TPA: carboxypeptidase-like regulatory domain-containing protein [Terracidiphilus sp.]|jgi:hypothetical protein